MNTESPDQTIPQSPVENPEPQNKSVSTKIIIKTIFFTSLICIAASGFFFFSYLKNTAKTTAPLATVPPTETPTSPETINTGGLDQGDETMGTDPAYIATMNKVPETTDYKSPFGYTIKLMKGWRKVDSMTLDNADGKREVFSPYTDEQIQNELVLDPYNPNYYLEVEVRDNPGNIPLKDWTEQSNHTPQAMGQQNFDTTLGSYPGVKVIGNQGTGYYDYYISANGKIYNPGYFFTQDEQWKSPAQFSLDTFETMIDSFVPAK